MRILVQRVFQAWVRVGGVQISRTKQGVLVLVGLTSGDTPDVLQHMANKVLNMRLWEKDGKSWNGSVLDIQGQIMAVSQFTLYAILKGNKPDFHSAMEAQQARQMFDRFVEILKKKYDPTKIQTGKFQHLMEVGSVNNGPVTIEYEKVAEKNQLKDKKAERKVHYVEKKHQKEQEKQEKLDKQQKQEKQYSKQEKQNTQPLTEAINQVKTEPTPPHQTQAPKPEHTKTPQAEETQTENHPSVNNPTKESTPKVVECKPSSE